MSRNGSLSSRKCAAGADVVRRQGPLVVTASPVHRSRARGLRKRTRWLSSAARLRRWIASAASQLRTKGFSRRLSSPSASSSLESTVEKPTVLLVPHRAHGEVGKLLRHHLVDDIAGHVPGVELRGDHRDVVGQQSADAARGNAPRPAPADRSRAGRPRATEAPARRWIVAEYARRVQRRRDHRRIASDSRAPSLSSDARQPSPGADASFDLHVLEDVSGAREPALIAIVTPASRYRSRRAAFVTSSFSRCGCCQSAPSANTGRIPLPPRRTARSSPSRPVFGRRSRPFSGHADSRDSSSASLHRSGKRKLRRPAEACMLVIEALED